MLNLKDKVSSSIKFKLAQYFWKVVNKNISTFSTISKKYKRNCNCYSLKYNYKQTSRIKIVKKSTIY